MKHTVVGVDSAKRVFQLYWVERETGEIVSVALKREKFLEHFVNRAPCLIGKEAGGGSQHCTRQLQGLGHVVKLLPGRRVKPFVGGNKNDGADARAVWTAVQQPGIKTVAVKSEAQQTVLALRRGSADSIRASRPIPPAPQADGMDSCLLMRRVTLVWPVNQCSSGVPRCRLTEWD